VVVVGGPTVYGDRRAVKVADCPAKAVALREVVSVNEVLTGAAVRGTVEDVLAK
jgi:hypothetical protein